MGQYRIMKRREKLYRIVWTCLLKCIFHFIFLNQTPYEFHLTEIFYIVEILSRNRQNLKPSNLKTIEIWKRSHRANKYTLKVRKNGNTRRRWEIYSQLTIKTPELRHRPRSNVLIVIFTYLTRRCSIYILYLNR